jgi:hypothetical protein
MGNTPWACHLGSLLKKERQMLMLSKHQAKIRDHVLWVYAGQQVVGKLDLKRRAQSIRALQIISGRAGKEVSKRAIHEQLTGNRYLKELHDQRIQKLFKRLELEIHAICGHTFWCWPGTNSVSFH